VDAAELKQLLGFHFSSDPVEQKAAFGCDLLLQKGDVQWGIVFCPDKTDGTGYLGAFEAAMQRIVDARREGPADLQLGMAVAFASTANGQSPSYRRALKKYSNSIVFEDLGLHLFLVTGEKAVDVLKPNEVNMFMRDLDKWIATRAQKSAR
jgi:hypothetical protein